MKKKRGKNRLTKHHVIPSSREGDNSLKNIARIKDKKHKAYHIMFSNMTPDEIIIELVENYWNNQWEWVAKAIDDGKW